MPLQDTLNELTALTNIQHQHIMDTLAAQLQAENMNRAHAILLQALPTPDARAKYDQATKDGNWAPLGESLGTSAAEARDSALSAAIAAGNIAPGAVKEGATAFLSGGLDSGQVAKSGFEAGAIAAAPHIFGQDVLQKAFDAQSLGGADQATLAAQGEIASSPVAVHKMAEVMSYLGIPATTRAQLAEQASAVGAQVGAQDRETQSRMMIAAGEQATQQQDASMRGQAAGTDHAQIFLKQSADALAALTKGGLEPIVATQQIMLYNANIQKLIQSGSLPPEAAQYASPGGKGMIINPSAPTAPGTLSWLLRKLIGR